MTDCQNGPDRAAVIADLRERLDRLTVALRILRVGVHSDTPGMQLAWLGQYNPAGPSGAVLALADDLPADQEVMVWAHEMAHVYRHPAGSAEDAEYGHDRAPEERIVHAAAAIICQKLGLDDYRGVMTARHAPHLVEVRDLAAEEVAESTQTANAVLNALHQTDAHPGWKTPTAS